MSRENRTCKYFLHVDLKGIPAENPKTIENTGVLTPENLIGHYKSKSEVPMDDDEKGISGLLTED